MRRISFLLLSLFVLPLSLPSYVQESQDYNTGTAIYFNFGLGSATFVGDEYAGSDKAGAGGRCFGLTFSFPLNRRSARFEFGFLYERTGTELNDAILNHRIELEYLTAMFNLGFEAPFGLQFSAGFYFSCRLSAWERGDAVADRNLEDVVEPGDIGFHLKLAQRIHLSRKMFLAPYIKGQVGFVNIYYSDFAQRNIMLTAGMEIGFRP